MLKINNMNDVLKCAQLKVFINFKKHVEEKINVKHISKSDVNNIQFCYTQNKKNNKIYFEMILNSSIIFFAPANLSIINNA